MSFKIDLKELSVRKRERVEWKENGDDINIVKEIVKTISAFANDISNFGGGYVVCGAREIKDEYGFPKVKYTRLSANKLKEIEGKVSRHCLDCVSPSLSPIVEEIENPENKETRILVFVILASAEAHTYRDGLTANYIMYALAEKQRRREMGCLLNY